MTLEQMREIVAAIEENDGEPVYISIADRDRGVLTFVDPNYYRGSAQWKYSFATDEVTRLERMALAA